MSRRECQQKPQLGVCIRKVHSIPRRTKSMSRSRKPSQQKTCKQIQITLQLHFSDDCRWLTLNSSAVVNTRNRQFDNSRAIASAVIARTAGYRTRKFWIPPAGEILGNVQCHRYLCSRQFVCKNNLIKLRTLSLL